jgi:hypothetical protein
MSDDAQSKPYKVTLKAGEGFAEPWVTVEGESEAQLAFLLKDLIDKGTFALVGEAAVALRQATHATQTAATVLGGQVQQGQSAQTTTVQQQPVVQYQPQQEQWPTPAQQGPPPDFAQPEAQVLQFPQQGQQQYQQQAQAQQQQQSQGAPIQGRVQPLENDFVGKGGHWPPAGPRPVCKHGPRDWKSFNSKSGKLTEMWACPFDRRGAFIPPGEAKCDVEWAN